MRHGKKFNSLSRTKSHRHAMLANMSCSLIQEKRITTTVAKAKALRGFVEPLITRSKEDSTHSRRVVFNQLNDKYAVAELFREVAPKVGDRPGGYTRIIRIGNRLGDNAEMCMIELVDFNEIYTSEKSSSGQKTKTRRSRRGGGGGKATTEATKTEATAKAEKPAPKAEEKKETSPKAEAKEDTSTKAETKTDPKKDADAADKKED